jgi:hypothetical protein
MEDLAYGFNHPSIIDLKVRLPGNFEMSSTTSSIEINSFEEKIYDNFVGSALRMAMSCS